MKTQEESGIQYFHLSSSRIGKISYIFLIDGETIKKATLYQKCKDNNYLNAWESQCTFKETVTLYFFT